MHARHPFTVVERYSATARLFHWLTALLVVVAYIVSVGGPEMGVYSAVNDFSRGSHELLGMIVFALTMARVCWWTIFPSPKSPEMPAWMEIGARLGQWAIYALLALVPVTAIRGAWLEGHPLALLAVGNIDPWLPQSRHLGLALADIHGWLGDALMWLAGLHATAALYHHFWRRDTVLLSMLPGR
jgi:cytochrome b561